MKRRYSAWLPSLICCCTFMTLQAQQLQGTYSFDKKWRIANADPYNAQLAIQDKHALNFPSVIIPAAGIAYGFIALPPNITRTLNLSTKYEIEEDHPLFHTYVDNHLQ